MHLYSKHPGPMGPESTTPSRSNDVSGQGAVRPTAPRPSALEPDKKQMSDVGWELAAHAAEPTQQAPLEPARAALIRERIRSGAYNTLEVVDAVARRLFERGDL